MLIDWSNWSIPTNVLNRTTQEVFNFQNVQRLSILQERFFEVLIVKQIKHEKEVFFVYNDYQLDKRDTIKTKS